MEHHKELPINQKHISLLSEGLSNSLINIHDTNVKHDVKLLN